MTHDRPTESKAVMPLEAKTVGQWMNQNISSMYSKDENKPLDYVKEISNLTDYLANPSIKKKNFLIINEIIETALPKVKDEACLKKLTAQIEANKKGLYDMKSVMEDMMANGEAKSNAAAKSFFDGEKAMAATATLYVHE